MSDQPSATHVDLAPGYRISRLIKGGWQLAGGHGRVERERAIADMTAFAEAGITTFDCADIYSGVEELIGEFLRRWRPAHAHPAGHVRVHTKFVPDLDALGSLTAHDIRRIIDRSRERLGLRALDLVQFHWWDYDIHGLKDTAHYLDALRQEGRIRQLGVTNFDTARLATLLDAGIPIIAHQLQYSLLDRRAAGTMASLCMDRGVGILAYGSLAGGFFSERWLGVPEPTTPLENRSLVKYKPIIDEFGGWALFQELLRVLQRIAGRHDVRIGTVAIRWVLDQPGVAAAIVGARDAGHLPHTLAALHLHLTEEDHAELAAVVARATGPSGEVYALERDRHGTHGRIMRYNLNAMR
ncbi:MAG TPA: aldo/keto reductase [Gemmatimonadaceae bacterium]|nr:aldo/keto reductase [Gemmatimonadaceae bacterium]